jgi:hypothetical protein
MMRAALALAVGLGAAACSKHESPPATDPAAERAAATERAKHEAFGTDVQALEKAKQLGADMNRKAEENLEKADPK